MYDTNLDLFKTQQNELHRQAAKYRLIRSFVNQHYWLGSVIKTLGQKMIVSGQQLMDRTLRVH